MKDLSEFPDSHLRIFERPPVPPRDEISDIYLIGICGTGMGSLAGLLQEAGFSVRGSDEKAYPPMSTRLAEMGIEVIEGYDPDHLNPPPDLVIIGNTCTPTHPEATYARDRGLPQLSMPEALSHFFIQNRRSLVVAGTHGKTTTTGMLVHALRHAELDPTFLVGGVMANGNINYRVGTGPHFVIEGDEYDSAYFDKQPKFMHYSPTSAIVTSMEFDHADIYEGWTDYREAFRAFANTVEDEGVLALNGDDPEVRDLANYTPAHLVRFFGLEGDDDDVTAADIYTYSGGQHFTLVVDGERRTELSVPMTGRHNLLNALAVCTIALNEGLTAEQIADAFASFEGMKRRQEVRGEADGVLIVDDFAHHPTAVKETIRAVADRWPDRRVVAIFEPRSNSSRRKTFEGAYAEAFDQAQRVFLSEPPLRHNDEADTLMNIGTVTERIRQRGVPASHHAGADELLPSLVEHLERGDTALIMSNGGFDNIHERLITALRDRDHGER